MTEERKDAIIEQIARLITAVAYDVEPDEVPNLSGREEVVPPAMPRHKSNVEMLTIKECADVIQGLSEHTVRHLVKQGKVRSFRTGIGRSGKILVNKEDLIAYFAA